MQPVVIDVAGTIKELVKWALTQALLLLGMLTFGLSAPLLFTLGAEWLAWRYPDYASTWTVIYMFAGPFACTIWMILVCHWPAIQRARRAGRLRTWRDDNGGLFRTMGKSFCFMFFGFVGSAAAEGGLVFAAHRMSLVPGHLMIFFAVAPFAVFAPVLLVLLSRLIRGDEYVTA